MEVIKIIETSTQIEIDGENYQSQIMKFEEIDKKNLWKLYKDWKSLNQSIKKYSTRGINLPEAISEGIFCCNFNSARVVKIFGSTSASFDSYDLHTKKRQQIKAASNNASPSSFGPNSVWDELYFLDFNLDNDMVDVYKIPNDLIYNQKVNSTQTFKEMQSTGKRPRFVIMKLIEENNLKPIKQIDLSNFE